MTQKLRYQVTQVFDGFELRHYEPFVSVEIDSVGDWLQAGNRAFQPLVGYISGQNQTAQKYAMTAPVLQTNSGSETHTVSFVLPVEASASVPAALDSRLRLIRHEGGQFAAISFRGRWSETLFDEKTLVLQSKLAAAGLKQTGPALTARYDPPWKPGFARSNEILIPVAVPQHTKE
ncbi:MAG: heme-binding protein [Actinomycetales bacterium]|nr:heme-binding protein [Actinomycetales bacterium]